MARRLTPDPLQVDPWTNPVRISFSRPLLFFLGFEVSQFTSEMVFNDDVKGEDTCPFDETVSELPCGDDTTVASITEARLRHSIYTKYNVSDATSTPVMGFYDLNFGGYLFDTLGVGRLSSSVVNRPETSWSEVFEKTDRAFVENDPTNYGGRVKTATFGVGEWSGFAHSASNVNQDVKLSGSIIGTSNDTTFREVGRVEKQWGLGARICGDLFCRPRALDFPRWEWPIEIGGFQQSPFNVPEISGMRINIDGVSYVLVAMAADPDNSGTDQRYFAFFQREDATRTLSEILS